MSLEWGPESHSFCYLSFNWLQLNEYCQNCWMCMTPCTRKTEELIVKYIYFYMPAESYGALSRAGMRRMCINTYSVSFSVKHVDSKATEQVNNTELPENISYRQKSLFSVKPETILLLCCWALSMTLHLSLTKGSGFLGRSFQMKWKWVISCFHITLAFILLLHSSVCL